MATFKTLTYQSIALAGIAQSTYLVDQLATQGKADNAGIEASLSSLLIMEPDNPVDIYGGLQGIKIGLEQLHQQLSENNITNVQQARYSASLVFLERKFANETDMQRMVHNKLKIAQNQQEHFGVMHENVIANLADIYQQSISTIQPRLMINGEQVYLSSSEIINKIRALLLAGIRSTMLWRQCGGNRLKFLMYRGKIRDELKFLLSELN